MVKNALKIAFVAALSCITVDAAFAAAAELGYDPFEPFMSDEALAERVPVEELPDGCHYHGTDVHCGADEALDIKW